MRFQRNGMGCADDDSCSCMPNTGMANGYNVASTLPGIPMDKALGTFDASLSTITFPAVPPLTSSNIGQATGLQIVPAADGTYGVILGTQTIASGLSLPQAQDVVQQQAPGAAVMAANPVAANVLSGNPLQPSIVGTDDGSGMVAPAPTPPTGLCSFATSANSNPLIVLGIVAAGAWLLTTKKGRK